MSGLPDHTPWDTPLSGASSWRHEPPSRSMKHSAAWSHHVRYQSSNRGSPVTTCSAAAALHVVTGEPRFDDWYRTWWDYAAECFIDLDGGSWRHELAPDNGVSQGVWSGKPDIYHALQATLIPRLPLSPVLAPALSRGLLD